MILQAQREGLDILAIPLGDNTASTGQDSYAAAVLTSLKPLRVKSLAFGDLHLRDIRKWRENAFGETYPCQFPIFGVSYDELLRRLWAEEGISVRVSSVSPEHKFTEGLTVGRVFDMNLVKDLPPGVDTMGENGEFHTHVHYLDKGRLSDRQRPTGFTPRSQKVGYRAFEKS